MMKTLLLRRMLFLSCLAITCMVVRGYAEPGGDKTKTVAKHQKNQQKPENAVQLQKIEIRGTVSDSVGPMPGVSIVVKNQTHIGTSTDLNGKYVLEVPNENAILVFSMVGYETQEIPVKGKSVINVLLKPSASQLDEVVYVAFGTQKRTDLVGSVTSINPSELKVPSSNLTTAGRKSSRDFHQRAVNPVQIMPVLYPRGTTFVIRKITDIN